MDADVLENGMDKRFAMAGTIGMLMAGCVQHEKMQQGDPKDVNPEEVRGALMEMVRESGNKWMGEELKDGKVEREGEGYRIGRWRFSVERMNFAFEQVNDSVTPPVFFGVSGVLERSADGKLRARVTGGRQT
jgi:hypothetical protein